MTNDKPIVSFAHSLFARGVESYDSANKTSVNVGGAQLFRIPSWKSNASSIKINSSKLEAVLRDLAATLYTVNRVMLDAESKPVKLENGSNRRVNSGLMLYMQFGANGKATSDARDRIIEACPELAEYVAPLTELMEKVPSVNCVTQSKVPGFDGDLTPMNPACCLLLAVPSGSPGSAQYWSFNNAKAKSREALNASQTAGPSLTDGDLPI